MSSHTIWKSIKRKLGENVWSWIPSNYARRSKSDGRGIKFVQSTLHHLYSNFDEFFTQPRIVYYPFYSGEHYTFYTFVQPKKGCLLRLAREIAQLSHSMMVYPPIKTDGRAAFYIVTNRVGAHKIFGEIFPRYVKNSGPKVHEDFHGSQKYWNVQSKFSKENNLKACYPKLFDPKTCEWKF